MKTAERLAINPAAAPETGGLPVSSRNIWFYDSYDIRLIETPLPKLKDDELLCRSVRSLISQGSEVVKYTREMDDSMHKKARESGAPFMGGYANSAEVLAVGKNVKGFQVGEKLACSVPHNEFFTVHPDYVTHTPAWVTHEENAWMTMPPDRRVRGGFLMIEIDRDIRN